MALGEFELIARYFAALGAVRSDVPLGVGDDAALLAPPAGQQLVAAIDTLVDGVHFPHGSPAASIGHRALAVNLSDLAAMGAEPAWALLALTLPEVNERWLSDFARGFGALAECHGVALVGGDTTSGPLSVTVQLLGFAPPGAVLRRNGASAGDLLYVSGSPGDAAEGLALELQGLSEPAALRQRFLYPQPRVALGCALRGVASACIDVSDGLLADAGKLATASGCGVEIDAALLPTSAALQARLGLRAAQQRALLGGDDYELCFAVPVARVPALEAQLASPAVATDLPALKCIGRLTAHHAIRALRDGTVMDLSTAGFDHFVAR